MNLRVAFVGGAVLHPDLEKEVPHFPQRTTIHGSGELFDRDYGPRHAPPHEPRDEVCTPLENETFALRRNGRFQIPDAGIELLEADCLGRLRVPQGGHLGGI